MSTTTTERIVWGISEDGRYALTSDGTECRVHTVRDGKVSEFGRWECSTQHLIHFADVYYRRFPKPAPGHYV